MKHKRMKSEDLEENRVQALSWLNVKIIILKYQLLQLLLLKDY